VSGRDGYGGKTHPRWRFEQSLEISHAPVGPIDSKYAFDFGCCREILLEETGCRSVGIPFSLRKRPLRKE
jgi:hypothetical protein